MLGSQQNYNSLYWLGLWPIRVFYHKRPDSDWPTLEGKDGKIVIIYMTPIVCCVYLDGVLSHEQWLSVILKLYGWHVSIIRFLYSIICFKICLLIKYKWSCCNLPAQTNDPNQGPSKLFSNFSNSSLPQDNLIGPGGYCWDRGWKEGTTCHYFQFSNYDDSAIYILGNFSVLVHEFSEKKWGPLFRIFFAGVWKWVIQMRVIWRSGGIRWRSGGQAPGTPNNLSPESISQSVAFSKLVYIAEQIWKIKNKKNMQETLFI